MGEGDQEGGLRKFIASLILYFLTVQQRTARREHALNKSQRHKDLARAHQEDRKRLSALYQQQVDEVQSQLAALGLQRQKEEQEMKAKWQASDAKMWHRIDTLIEYEEKKKKAKLEEERKQKEEEERKQQEALEKRRKEEEKKQKEEEEKRLAKEREEEEKRKRDEAEKQRVEREQAEANERRTIGMSTAMDDWKYARTTLKVGQYTSHTYLF